MTLPAWPIAADSATRVAFSTRVTVPQSRFQSDFGVPITRPRSTAADEIADFEVVFFGGDFPEFRTWWAETARGGAFTWTRTDLGTACVVQPIDGGYAAQTIRGALAGSHSEIIRVTFSGHLSPAPAS